MIILGIDPGIAVTGFGVVEFSGGRNRCLKYGVIRTDADMSKELRLCHIYRQLTGLIQEYQPHSMAVELLFFNRNTKTALTVGEARGVVLLSAGQCGIPLFEYTPLQVKECLTGYGRAKKMEVREVVQMDLDMEKPPTPIDASDALALALTHLCLMEDNPEAQVE